MRSLALERVKLLSERGSFDKQTGGGEWNL